MNDSIDETLIRFLASMQQSGAAWSPWLYELGTIVRDVKQLASSELTPRAAEIVRKLDTDLLDTQTELSVALADLSSAIGERDAYRDEAENLRTLLEHERQCRAADAADAAETSDNVAAWLETTEDQTAERIARWHEAHNMPSHRLFAELIRSGEWRSH